MKTITIQVPDDCEVKIVKKNNNPKNCPFQEGDVLTSGFGNIVLFKRLSSDNAIVYSAILTKNSQLEIRESTGVGYINDVRFATEEERQKFIDALKQSKDSLLAKDLLKKYFNIVLIKTYQDLIDSKKSLEGWYIRTSSEITEAYY